MKRRWLLLILMSIVQLGTGRTSVALADTGASASADERFVEGLVARRLFAMAELACRERLAVEGLSPREQVSWTVELIRVLARHAAHSLPAEQGERWQAAHEAVRQFRVQHASHPRRILVELQDALTYLAEGELARLESDIAADPTQAFQRARDTIRTAAKQLEAIDKQLTEMLATASRQTSDSGQLTADELFSLQNNVRFQRARALRNQGLSYPAGSNDRVAALSAAVKQLSATLTQLRSDDALTWQVYLDLGTCHRLLGDLPQAQRALASLLAESAPESMRLQAVAEQARIMIAADRAQVALGELDRARSAVGATSPDLDSARLEAMLSLWKAALDRKDEVLAKPWQQKVAVAVAAMEQQHGAYWGRRAKLLQLSVAEKGAASGNIEIITSSADELCVKKEYDQAIAMYEKAAGLARTTGELQKALDAEFTAALVEQKLNRFEAASRRLQQIALAQVSSPSAATRHLRAAFCAAQVVRSDPSAIVRYQALLDEHLEKWPSDESSNKARMWLGDLHRSQVDWEAAANAYRGVQPSSEYYELAIERLASCWEEQLRSRQRAGEPIETLLTDATGFLDAVILGSERQWPERWSAAQLSAALATARVRLEYAPKGLVDAQRVLQAALDHAPVDDEAWLQEAQSLLVVALAGQTGQQQEALKLLQQLGAKSIDHLLQLIDGLSVLAKTAAPSVSKQIAQVQLAALKQLEDSSSELDKSQKLRVEQVRAESLRASGQLEQALGVFRRLAAEQPDNGAVQLGLADLLLQADDPATLSEAIVQWQKVGRRIRPGTDDWLRARYSIALALYKRNQPAQDKRTADRAVAAQRLKYLKATTDVDKTDWKRKVDQLLQRCSQNSPVP